MSGHFLALSNNPDGVSAQMKVLDSSRPGVATHTWAYNLQDFEKAAKEEKDKVLFVLLGPDLSDEQVKGAKKVVEDVWGKVKESKTEAGEGKWVLQIPSGLKGEETTQWVIKQVEA